MVESPVSLANLCGFDFVRHHDHYCSIHRTNPSRCAGLGFQETEGGAYFLARAAVTGTDLGPCLSRPLNEDSSTASHLRSAFNRLIFAVVGRNDPSGTITAALTESVALARAIMSAYTYSGREEARLLAHKFADLQALVTPVAAILTDVTGFGDWGSVC
jgi:hypothetical protein